MSATTLAFFRRDLPHWLVAEKSYFVTLRLQGTLPRDVVEDMRRERERAESEDADTEHMDTLHRRQFQRIEAILDGLQWVEQGLCREEVGSMLLDNLDWLRGRGWTVFATALMSTHAHVLMRNQSGRSGELIRDLDAFKSFTGGRANRITGREGRYWARDDFDHWVRSPESFERFLRYIVNNPVKIGLVEEWQDWPWTVVDDSVRELLE